MTSQTAIRNKATSLRAPRRRTDLIGYAVGAVGGDVGYVDPATADVDLSKLVVRTGRWGSRRRVVVPAGSINCVDHLSHRISLEATRKMVNDAPRLDAIESETLHNRWRAEMQEPARWRTDPPYDGGSDEITPVR
jgi:hypothetical protein